MAAYDTSAWSCCHGGSVASVLGVFSLLQSPPFAVCHPSCRFRLIPFPRIARVTQTHGCGDAYPCIVFCNGALAPVVASGAGTVVVYPLNLTQERSPPGP